MKVLPATIGTLHFIGIGGIGMSGIAEVLHNMGYKVQGSDLAENANVKRLRELGLSIAVGQNPENLGDAKIVVISSAVKEDNVELAAARAANLPVVRRAEMLGEIMRLKWCVAVAGTHGKTTTTTLAGHLFEVANLDPTLITGGIINGTGTNARLGAGDWMVVETDESDGSFQRLPITIGVVTNIDPEHLDHYGSFGNLKAAFDRFLDNIPFYGFGVLCADHPETIALKSRHSSRRIVTYGFASSADVSAQNVKCDTSGCSFDIIFGTEVLRDVHLPMYGRHNIQNALAVAAIGHELKIPHETIRTAFASFKGVGRRFTKVGEANGVTVIDDYAHHPAEITATLSAARSATHGKIIAVMQPHRYSRLASLMGEFAESLSKADHVIVADVYAAGEKPIEGVNRDGLLKYIDHPSKHALETPEALAALVNTLAQPGDLILCMGAGSITNWAHLLPQQLILKQETVAA